MRVVSLLLTSARESGFICWPDWTDEISIFFIKGLPASVAGLPFPITHSLSIMQKEREGERDRSPDRGCKNPAILSGTGCLAHADASLTSPAALQDLLRLRLGTTSPSIPRHPSPGAQLAVVPLNGAARGPKAGTCIPPACPQLSPTGSYLCRAQ